MNWYYMFFKFVFFFFVCFLIKERISLRKLSIEKPILMMWGKWQIDIQGKRIWASGTKQVVPHFKFAAIQLKEVVEICRISLLVRLLVFIALGQTLMLFQSNVLIFNFLMPINEVLYSDMALSTANAPPGIHKATHTHTCSRTQLCTN